MSRLSAIAHYGRRVLTAMDVPSILREGMDLARRELDVNRCDLLQFLPVGDVELVAACDVQDNGSLDGSLNVEAGSPAGRVLQSQLPLAIEDLRAAEWALPPYLAERQFTSSLNVPVYGPDRLLGVIGAHSRARRTFPSDEVDFLQTLSHLISLALQRNTQDEQRRTRRMLRAEQMMAIGQVAAGVAHELRNPLTSIKGLIQVNLREWSSRGLPSDDLAVIEHEIRRMERTLQTFLDFARPPQPNRKPLDLSSVVDRVFSLVSGRAQKQHVTLRKTYEGTVRVNADEDQLQQLFLNLTLNSLDAMPDGGDVEILVRPPIDGFVEVIVRDDGPGIPADILPKVFATFVSSKETGVGLGLAVSQRIAEGHGGALSAYNLPGSGACFTLRLPACE